MLLRLSFVSLRRGTGERASNGPCMSSHNRDRSGTMCHVLPRSCHVCGYHIDQRRAENGGHWIQRSGVRVGPRVWNYVSFSSGCAPPGWHLHIAIRCSYLPTVAQGIVRPQNRYLGSAHQLLNKSASNASARTCRRRS
jgi:hypothetical protein